MLVLLVFEVPMRTLQPRSDDRAQLEPLCSRIPTPHGDLVTLPVRAALGLDAA